MSHGTQNWFEIGTDDADATKKFYSDVFGWTYRSEREKDGEYELVVGSDGAPQGGLVETGGQIPTYAIPYVQVDDVPATVSAFEDNGGKVLLPLQKTPNGLQFAHVLDPHGNRFGVYTPAP